MQDARIDIVSEGNPYLLNILRYSRLFYLLYNLFCKELRAKKTVSFFFTHSMQFPWFIEGRRPVSSNSLDGCQNT